MSLDHASLLVVARDLLHRPARATAGLWPRATALMIRQALEATLNEFWQTHAPEVSQAATHAQLLCLRRYLGDEHLAGRVAWTWASLSRACHHHAYDMPPSSTELAGWIEVVEEFGEKAV
jgi:hypothetical protein